MPHTETFVLRPTWYAAPFFIFVRETDGDRLIGRIITIIFRTWDFQCRSWILVREGPFSIDIIVASIIVILFLMEKLCWMCMKTGDNGSSSWYLIHWSSIERVCYNVT